MNPFSKIVAILIAAIIMFISPLLYMAQKQDIISQTYVSNETIKFIDNIKNTGVIDAKTYQAYVNKIDATGNIYDIEIVHAHKVVDPLYDVNTGAFLNDYDIYYTNTYSSDILATFDEGKEYYFSQGDYISITVKNRSKTFATKLMESFYRTDIDDEQILVSYGGLIRDENY
jgi:hypothetical protein